LTEVGAQFPGQLHLDPIPGTYFYYFDAQKPPFDDVRVRRAVNYAVDRDAVVDLTGSSEVAEPTCQVLPPNFSGYKPYCPYTSGSTSDGRWHGPDVDKARRLVAASGTKGTSIKVWSYDRKEGEYVTHLLRRLGYRPQLRVVSPFTKYASEVFGPRSDAQIYALHWFADYPVASGFITTTIFSCSFGFCDRKIDRDIAHARRVQVTDPGAANALWARIDRELTDQAPWLFLYNPKQADFVSSRVGNFQYNLQYGILLDQLWVK
jgi:peptide/nickel transport system substrate-binding protein